MKPEIYYQCLCLVSERDGLPRSSFAPAQIAEVLAVEEELSESLPVLYEEHLLRLGSGEEFGGLARWLHLDLSRSGNILCSDTPKGFLPIYDSCEGELYGYYRNGKPFSNNIFIWEGNGKPESYVATLQDFYMDRLDCSEEEIEQVQEQN